MYKALMVLALLCAASALAQPVPRSIEALDLSYVYAPIFGTGYYRAGVEQAAILKVDTNDWLLDQADDARWYWLLPVTAGVRYTELGDVVDEVLSGSLLNLSVLPGVARRFTPGRDWVVAPSLQLGAAHDFTLHTNTLLYTAAVRSTQWWSVGRDTLTFGNRVRLAGQHALAQHHKQGFALIESGLDWRRPVNWTLAGEPLEASVFFYGQYFIQNTGLKGASGERLGAQTLYNLGVTLGWQRPRSYLGFSLQRLGLSAVLGDDVRALTVSVGFPLAID